jgi:hypothetical protein
MWRLLSSIDMAIKWISRDVLLEGAWCPYWDAQKKKLILFLCEQQWYITTMFIVTKEYCCPISVWTFFFTAQDDNSASCEQETDGLHKALEASILRNEVCCIIHSQLYDVLAVQLGLDIFNMYWSCDPISSS